MDFQSSWSRNRRRSCWVGLPAAAVGIGIDRDSPDTEQASCEKERAAGKECGLLAALAQGRCM